MDNFYTILMVMEKQWVKILDQIKPMISVPNYRTWFAPSKLVSVESGVAIINVPSSFVQTNITRFLPILEPILEKVVGGEVQISFKVDPSLALKKSPIDELNDGQFDLSSPPTPPSQSLGLNPKYNLANFVVGLSNNLAYAAAQAVIQNPGVSYNPLFVYGGTGVGKTHLMHAIGNALLKKDPGVKIIYCSSERFMNDFIESIRSKQTNEFRRKYRSVNLLLIDDIQFISGRDSTQEEFFHTFNELQTKNTQIVLTSDRPPNEIQKLEARLASRFQGGLMVDIQTPDFDTRVAILRAKCQERGWGLPEESLLLIAQVMTGNARELEGKLIQIVQSLQLSHLPVTPEAVQRLLGQAKPQPQLTKLDHKKVISGINQYFNIKMSEITGPRRKKGLVLPRQLAMYLLYEECKLPYERIGEVLGGRDHTTIMHGVEKMREATQRDREVQRLLIEIKQQLST